MFIVKCVVQITRIIGGCSPRNKYDLRWESNANLTGSVWKEGREEEWEKKKGSGGKGMREEGKDFSHRAVKKISDNNGKNLEVYLMFNK